MIFNAYSEQKEQAFGISLVSCGHIFAKQGREINRPSGRDDWLLFYIVKESETFFLNTTKTGTAGSFIIFAPWEKQHHVYNGNKTAEFYYVHFKCDALPNSINLKSSVLYDAPFNREVCDIFESILNETIKKQPFYEKVCICKLLYILSLIERDVAFDSHPQKQNFKNIANAVAHMNAHFDSNFSLADYADMCAMSRYHFLRVFEQIVGSTPMEYRTSIRLQHARDMLLEQNVSVEQISATVGYSSPSYFCSAFKKKYGLSPKQFQKERS